MKGVGGGGRLRGPAIVAVCALLLAACGPRAGQRTAVPPHSGPADRVVVGYSPLLNFAGLYSAIENGAMKSRGIEVELQRVNSGAEATSLLAQGQLDVAGIGLAARVFNDFNRGLDMRIVASAGIWGPQHETMILGQGDKVRSGEIKGLTDLKGRRVGINGGPGSAAAYLMELGLRPVGLSVRDVQIVNVPSVDIPVALKNGTVDAAISGVPYARQAVSEGWGVPLLRNFEPGNATSAYIYTGKFMKERPDVAARFTIALMEGTRAIQGLAYFSDQNMTVWNQYTGVRTTIIRGGEPLLYPPELPIARESIIKQERVHRELGYTDYRDPVPLERMIDESFARKALAALGPYKP